MKRYLIILAVLGIALMANGQGSRIDPYIHSMWRDAISEPNAHFQPATDSTTFFQILTSGGDSVFNADSINRQCTVGYTSATYPFLINSTDASDQIQMYHNNTDAYFYWNDGELYLETTENTHTKVNIRGPGTSRTGYLRVFDHDNAEYIELTAINGQGRINAGGANPVSLSFEHNATVPIRFFAGSEEGETKSFEFYGFRTGDSLRYLAIDVGAYSANTATFRGVSEYRFDGTVRANTGFDINGSAGVSGTLELDDGSTEKITLVFTGGILTSRTVAATTGSALADWTD